MRTQLKQGFEIIITFRFEKIKFYKKLKYRILRYSQARNVQHIAENPWLQLEESF